MAYNEKLAARVRTLLTATRLPLEEKAMFGGLCFMVNEKMCLGVEAERLMVRFDPDQIEDVKKREGFRPMDFTGRVMKGYAFVDIKAISTAKKLSYWVQLALAYNPKANPSAKRKNK